MTAAGPAAPRDSRAVLERPSRRQPRARPLPATRGEPAGRGEKLSSECGRVPQPNKRAGTGRGAAGRGTRLAGARSAAEPRGSPPGTRFPQRRRVLTCGRAVRGGESRLAGASAGRARRGFRHVSDVGTTWGPGRPTLPRTLE